MTYNVFGGSLSLTQSIRSTSILSLQPVIAVVRLLSSTLFCHLAPDVTQQINTVLYTVVFNICV